MTDQKQSQIDKFKEAARALEADDDPERFRDRLKKLVKHKLVEKSAMIVTFYLTSPQYVVPDFKDRREMDHLPAVDDIVEISGDEPGKMISVIVRANSETKPGLAAVLNDKGAWAICQQT